MKHLYRPYSKEFSKGNNFNIFFGWLICGIFRTTAALGGQTVKVELSTGVGGVRRKIFRSIRIIPTVSSSSASSSKPYLEKCGTLTNKYTKLIQKNLNYYSTTVTIEKNLLEKPKNLSRDGKQEIWHSSERRRVPNVPDIASFPIFSGPKIKIR